MGGEIPEEMVIVYQDAFKQFDEKNSGMVSTKKLGQLLRFVGENPSDAEVQVWIFFLLTFLATATELSSTLTAVRWSVGQ